MQSKSPALRWLQRGLLAAGVLGVGICAVSKVVPPLWQQWENRQFNLAREKAPATQSNDSAARPARPTNGQVLGRLSIPRLELSSMVREGDDEATLSLALGHIPSTALPGQDGNIGVAGHRDTLFRALRKIQKNDLIQFETLNGMHSYTVDSIHIVKPEDVGVLKPQGRPTLTLVTCYPFYYIGAAPNRFIVSAHEVPVATAAVAKAQPNSQAQATQADESKPRRSPAASAKPATRLVAFHSLFPESLSSEGHPGATHGATFEIRKGQSREVAPGVSLGITDTDPSVGGVYGWIVLAREHRTILLSDQKRGQPVVFNQDGLRHKLQFTQVSAYSATVSAN